MSNHGYTAENFLSLLPHVLAEDPRMNALATAIAKALITHLDDLQKEEIYNRIDELPEGVLDILANDFKIDWYNFDYPIDAKRNLVKTNYYVHRHLGTYGSVLTAVRAIYPKSVVEEWFNYDAEPYHFRIALESALPIIPFSTESLLTAVYRYKSLRSHLDGIIFRCSVHVGIKVKTGYVLYWGRITGTWPQRARQGEIYYAEIDVITDNLGVVYDNPHTGEINAGTFPARAVQGMVMPGDLEVTPSADGLAYNARLCGTAPGGLL